MIELQEIVQKISKKDSVVIQGEVYRVDNAVYITETDLVKARLLLKGVSSENKVSIDVDIFAKIYRC